MKRISAPVGLVIVNIAVFLTVWIVSIVAKVSGNAAVDLVDWLALPSSPAMLLHRPWTLLTYMFTQYNIWHIVFNMLMLYWMGEFLMTLLSGRRVVLLYLIGGLAGGLLFFGAAQAVSAVGGTLVGASAAVLAIIVAAGVMMPDLEVMFMLLFRLKLKWVALAIVVIFVFAQGGGNLGGQAAHLGGALVGLLYGIGYRRGCDFLAPLDRLIDRLMSLKSRPAHPRKKLKPKPRPVTDNPTTELDQLLDKIRKSGYQSLTPDERERLNRISNNL